MEGRVLSQTVVRLCCSSTAVTHEFEILNFKITTHLSTVRFLEIGASSTYHFQINIFFKSNQNPNPLFLSSIKSFIWPFHLSSLPLSEFKILPSYLLPIFIFFKNQQRKCVRSFTFKVGNAATK